MFGFLMMLTEFKLLCSERLGITFLYANILDIWEYIVLGEFWIVIYNGTRCVCVCVHSEVKKGDDRHSSKMSVVAFIEHAFLLLESPLKKMCILSLLNPSILRNFHGWFFPHSLLKIEIVNTLLF